MKGNLQKMRAVLDKPVQYELMLGDHAINLNVLLNRIIHLRYTGNIHCRHCGRLSKKSFNRGYCYPCFTSLAQCDMCILKPETCHYAHGTCREPRWGEAFCMQPHFVYLANSSGVKVGITRQNQVPTRWIDQGAVQALPIFKVQSRHLSGLVEVIIAQHISDKTSWQQMLKNNFTPIDLTAKRDELLLTCQTELAGIAQRFGEDAIEFLPDEKPVELHYPVKRYPEKVKSFNLDTNPGVSGILEGIKGQYLLLDSGVINLRKYAGYEVEFSMSDKADELLQ